MPTIDDAVAAEITAAIPQKKRQSAPIFDDSAQSADPESQKAAHLNAILNNITATNQAVTARQTVRSTQLQTSIAKERAIIADADNNLQTKASSTFAFIARNSPLLDQFAPEYSARVQNNRKKQAAQTIRADTAIDSAQARSDKRALDLAKAPLDTMVSVQKYKQGELQLDLSQTQVVIQNLDLQKQLAEIKQSTVTTAEARERLRTGNFTPEINEAFLEKKVQKDEMLMNDLEASADARALGKIQLANHYEQRALEKLDLADLQAINSGSQQLGLKTFDLGQGRSLPMHAINQRTAVLEAQAFENEKAVASRIDELSKFSTLEGALIEDAMATALTTPAGETISIMPSSADVINATQDELVQMDVFNRLPSDVASAVFDVSRTRAVLDDALKTRTATTAQFSLYNKQVARMKEVTKQHTDDFIAGISKKRQPAFRKLVSNRMVVSNPNQGSQILAETGLGMPNFKGNEALGKGFEQFVLQYAEQKGFSSKANAQDNSPEAQEARVEAMMAKFMAPDFSATTDHTELMKAINQKSTDSIYSVKETILNEQSTKMFYSSMLTLGEADADLQKLMFNADGSQSQAWLNDAGQISQKTLLVNMVNLGKQKFDDASFYVRPLNEALNKTLETFQPQMSGFAAPNAQSFIKMVFPFEKFSTLVDRKLNKNLRITLQNAIHDANNPTAPSGMRFGPSQINF